MSAERLTLTLSLFLTAGCATAPSANPGARSGDLEKTMVELRAQNAGYMRQIDELQNKIFILEETLEDRRIAEERQNKPPTLVSKRIGVAASEPAPSSPSSSFSSSWEVASQPFVAEDSTVEFAGEAALPVRRERERVYARPVLRLSGSGNTATISLVSPQPADTSFAARRIVAAAALRLYRQSVDALHDGRNGVALAGFRKFLTRYPHHDYADNAQYYIGECYYDLNQFHASAREFRRVVDRYPHGNKVPEAMLKLGLSQLATGERSDGRRVLESLRRIYPKQAAARVAADRLAQADDTAVMPTVSLEMPRR
jgi:tol-pal system protein YbgF